MNATQTADALTHSTIDLGTDARGWKLYDHDSHDALVAAGVVFYADEDGLHEIPEPIVESARIEARKDAAAFVEEYGEACDAQKTDWPDTAWEMSETRARLVGEGWNADDVYGELSEVCAVYVVEIERESTRLVAVG
jgi:hypothetical protein